MGTPTLDDDILVTGARTPEMGQPVPRKPKRSPVLGALWKGDGQGSPEGRNVNIAAKGRCCNVYLLPDVEVLSATFEAGIRLDVEHDEEVAGQVGTCFTLARHPERMSILHSRRHIHL